MATKAEIDYVAMRWSDAAKFSAKAREIRDIIAWLSDYSRPSENAVKAMEFEADRLYAVAETIRRQCQSLAGWQEWSNANIISGNLFS